MNLYLVSSPSHDVQKEILLSEFYPNHLLSYANLDELKPYKDVFLNTSESKVLIDSGAFTAFTCGRVFDPEDYAQWALSFQDEWSDKLSSLLFFNLDVIGDQDKTWENQKILEDFGMSPIPIVTHNADVCHLLRAIEEYDYFALGGLVQFSRGRYMSRKVRSWLDFCFKHIVSHFKKTGIMPKVHLLGMGRPEILMTYPAYSADSSSWVKVLRWGAENSFGLKKVPKLADSKMSNKYILREEVRKFRDIERKATALWRKRGVIFNE
jgi:hypothetical protein